MFKRTTCVLMMAIGSVAVAPFTLGQQPVPPPASPTRPAWLKEGDRLLKSYSPPDSSYQILYPSEWKVVPGHVPGNAVMFVEPTETKPGEAKYLISLAITPSKKGVRLEDIGKGEADAAPKKLSGFQRIVDQGIFNLNDRKAFHLVCDMQTGGILIRTFQYTFLDDGVAYTVTLMGPPEKVKRDEDLATQITGLLKINAAPKLEAANTGNVDAQAPGAPPATPPAQAGRPGQVALERWVASDNAFAVSYPKGWEPKQLPDNPAGGAGGAAVVSPLFTNTADAGEGKPDTFWVTTAGLTTVNLPPPPSTPNRPSAPNRPAPRNDTPPPPPAPAPVRNFRAWAKAVREGVAQKVTDFKLVSENQASLGGTVALRLIFDSKQDKGGDTVRMIQWICEKGDKAYVLTFMFDPKRMTKVIPIEQAVSRSFVFAPKDAPTDTHKVSGEPTPFEDKAHGFRLTYPPGWGSSAAKLPGVALALGKNASTGKVAQLLMVISNPLEPNEKVTLKEMEALLDKLLPAAGLKDAKTAEATDIKLGGAAARRLVMTGTRQADDHAIRALGVVALNNRTAVLLIGAAPVEDFDAFQSDFDKVTESFAFLDAQAPTPAPAGATADATPAKPTAPPPAPTPAKPTATPPAATPTAATPPAAATADPASNIDVPDAAMTLAAPAGWTVRKAPAPGIPLMLVSTPAKPGGRPSTITLATEPVPASGARPSPAQLADDAVKGFKATASDAKVTETTDPKVGGQRARQVVVAAHRNIGNIDLRVVIVCFYGGDKAVTLTGEAPAAEFDALKAAMDQVVTSATVKMGTPLRRPQ